MILVICLEILSFGLNKLKITKFSKDVPVFLKLDNIYFAKKYFNNLTRIFKDIDGQKNSKLDSNSFYEL